LTFRAGNCQVPRVKTITSEDLRWNLTRVGKEAEDGVRWIVTFRGKPRFAIVPLADLKEELPAKPEKRPKAQPRK
jgi:prevent-host-death family protein